MVAITKLLLPGDWRKKLDAPGIPAMAASMKMVGVIHEPVVRESDWKLGPGAHRVAAALHNGESEVLCKLIKCTDDELELMCLIENAYRKNLTPPEEKKLVDQLAERIAIMRAEKGKETILEPLRKKGKLKLPRTEARELLAQVSGRSKEGQRKLEQRVEKRKLEQIAKIDHDADIGIRSPWGELDDEFRKKTNDVVRHTYESATLLSRALGRLTELSNSGLPLHRARMNRVREDLALLSSTLRGLTPTCLCPFCKGVEELQALPCGGCMGTGYVTQNQEEGIPSELWSEGDGAVVIAGGQFVPYSRFFAEEPSTDMTMTTEEDFAE
jgi:ParB-like chromosome segregation protein Spo0J